MILIRVLIRVLTFCLWSSGEGRFFSQTNFASAYIKSFKSMMFVGIFVNRSFTLSVSDLTVLQSCFLGEGNVLFSSDMIHFMISTLIFSL